MKGSSFLTGVIIGVAAATATVCAIWMAHEINHWKWSEHG
jgi:hypothetical protein